MTENQVKLICLICLCIGLYLVFPAWVVGVYLILTALVNMFDRG